MAARAEQGTGDVINEYESPEIRQAFINELRSGRSDKAAEELAKRHCRGTIHFDRDHEHEMDQCICDDAVDPACPRHKGFAA